MGMLWRNCSCVHVVSAACSEVVYIHDKQAKAKIDPGQLSLFSEKTALGGIQTHDTPRSR